MNQIRSGTGATAAVLAGSLAVFPLLDVLGLLSRTKHVGELQVVGDGVEAHLWVDSGDLLERPGTSPDRLFELAAMDDAWFTVTAATLPEHATEGATRVPLEPLIEHIGPQVSEWQSLVRALPFGAVAKMAPSMPGPEVHIRSDQWRILSLIGAGRPVHEVVDVSDARPLETLRLIYELAEQELISVELPGTEGATDRGGEDREHEERPPRHMAETPSLRPDAPPRPAAASRPEPPSRPSRGPTGTPHGARAVPVRATSAGPVGWRRSGATSTIRAPERTAAPEQEAEVPEVPEVAGHAEGTESSPPPASVKPPAKTPVAAYMPPPLAPLQWPDASTLSSGDAHPRMPGTNGTAAPARDDR